MDLLAAASALRRLHVRRAALDAFYRMICGLAGFCALGLAADRLFLLTRERRLALLGAGAAAAALCLWRRLARPLLRFRWSDLFDETAAAFPQLRPFLRSAWELRGGASGGTSEALRLAHQRRAEALLAGLDLSRAVSWRADRRLAAVAIAAGLSLPWHDLESWRRLAAPWKDQPLDAFVETAPGDASVDWGKSLEITARWARRLGKEGLLELWLKGPRGWTKRDWDRGSSDGSFAAGFQEVAEPLEYRLRWRELSTRVYRIEPVPAPELTDLRARVHGARGAEARPLSAEAELAVWRGDWVALIGRPNQELARARLRFSGAPQPLEMRRLPSGEFEASFHAREDAAFHFELETEDGRRDPRPIQYALRVKRDEPPVIELLSPAAPISASPRDVIPVAFSARDDLGLREVSMRISPSSGKAAEAVLRRWPEGRQTETELVADHALDLSAYPSGSRVEFQLRVRDRGQEALSQKGVIELIDFEAEHADVEQRWLAALERVSRLAAKEERIKEALSRGDSREASEQAAPLPAEWKASAEELSALASALGRDAYANPGVAEQVRSLAEELERARARELSPALEAAKAGRWEEAARRHGELAKALRRAERGLKQGAEVQGLQDFFMQAGRLAQSGAEVEAALEQLSQAGAAASPEARARLDRALQRLEDQMEALRKTLSSLPPPATPEQAAKARDLSAPVGKAAELADLMKRAIADGDYDFAAKMAQALSEQLARVQDSIRQAAAAAPMRQRSGPGALDQARRLWKEAVAGQARSLEETQSLEKKKLDELLEGQKALLAELARRQQAVVSSAAALGSSFPADSLGPMRAAAAELRAGAVKESPRLLRDAAARLRAQAPHFPEGRCEAFAAEEDSIREALESAPQSTPQNRPDPAADAAAERQGQTRRKTGELARELESLREELTTLPEGAAGRVGEAQEEQRAAEDALRQGKTGEAVRRQEKALELLQDVDGQMRQCENAQQRISGGLGAPFEAGGSQPGGQGAAGRQGSRLGPVGLPSAKDYKPPRELREELERSLREKRPAEQDKTIKEYFKRIAQ